MAADHYAQYEPQYLSRVVDVIDAFFVDVGRAAIRPIVPIFGPVRSKPVPDQSPKGGQPLENLVEPMGFEPTTSTVQRQRLPRKTEG
jgi:hypothetical protein